MEIVIGLFEGSVSLQRDCAKGGKEARFKKIWVRNDATKKDDESSSKSNVKGGENEVPGELWDKQDDEDSKGSENK